MRSWSHGGGPSSSFSSLAPLPTSAASFTSGAVVDVAVGAVVAGEVVVSETDVPDVGVKLTGRTGQPFGKVLAARVAIRTDRCGVLPKGLLLHT